MQFFLFDRFFHKQIIRSTCIVHESKRINRTYIFEPYPLLFVLIQNKLLWALIPVIFPRLGVLGRALVVNNLFALFLNKILKIGTFLALLQKELIYLKIHICSFTEVSDPLDQSSLLFYNNG